MTSSDAVRDTTLADLNRELFDNSGAASAAVALEQPWLRFVWGVWDMARNAWGLPTEPDAFDDLLSYWSILEVARVADVLRHPLPRHGIRGAAALLGTFVRAECRRRKLALPWFVRQSLEGSEWLPPVVPVDLRVFQWYLDLTMPLRGDADVRALLSRVREPSGAETLASALRRTLDDNTPREGSDRASEQAASIVRGFLHFCSYAEELDRLLSASGDHPGFQAAVWHSHPDWPAHHRAIADAIRKNLHELIERRESGGGHAERLAHLSEVIERLLGSMPWPSEWPPLDQMNSERERERRYA